MKLASLCAGKSLTSVGAYRSPRARFKSPETVLRGDEGPHVNTRQDTQKVPKT